MADAAKGFLRSSMAPDAGVWVTQMQRWAAAAAVLVAGLLLGQSARAATVKSANPYWFQEDYRTTAAVNLAASTAVVNTATPGTVQLPYAPLQAAFDPSGTYALVATEGGVDAYVFDGQGVLPVTTWSLGSLSATGVAWVDGGDAFAISTASQVVVYGLNQQGTAVLAAQTAAAGVIGLAPGPAALPSAVLAATSGGAQVYEAQGASLVPVSGGPGGLTGNLGVVATTGGSVAATWQQEAVQLWTWDGAAFLRAVAWDPPIPPGADGPVVGVAFFPQGGGYWVLTQQGQLLAYAYGPAGLSALSGWSLSVQVSPDVPVTVASGWGPAAAAVVYPMGWDYEDLVTGNTFGQDSIRSLAGQRWAAYAPRAVLESVALPVGHPVTQLRVEDADCAAGQSPPNCTAMATVPAGTSVGYRVSTDGCRTWTATPVFTNVTAPSGSSICYQITLTTSDPAVTPVVDVTNLYEIAQQKVSGNVASLLCTGSSC